MNIVNPGLRLRMRQHIQIYSKFLYNNNEDNKSLETAATLMSGPYKNPACVSSKASRYAGFLS